MADVFSGDDRVRLLIQLQRLLHEGATSATYKFALILAIADVCVEEGDDSGAAMTITTTALAGRFVRYYWRQAMPFPGVADILVLQQNTGRQAEILKLIGTARDAHNGSLARLWADQSARQALVKNVRATIEKMPLWKLQTVGRQQMEFLYPSKGHGHEIELRPGVAAFFRQFHELIEDLVQGAWIRFVRTLPANQPSLGQVTDLSEFLFGTERAELKACRPILAELQEGRCFYCQHKLRADPEVDHFIPWSRYPVDLGHNYVVADASCNGHKADRLAGVEHLKRWTTRNEVHGSALAAEFTRRNVASDPKIARSVAQWAYAQAEAATAQVWTGAENLVALTPSWRVVLACAV